MAIMMNRESGRPLIIPVIADECVVPTRLRHLRYINFVGRYTDALYELIQNGFRIGEATATYPDSGRAAFKSQPEAGPVRSRKGSRSHGWIRPLVFIVALVVFMINLPFLFFYTTDIILASRSVNDELQTVAPGASVVIQYDRILQANTSDAKQIRVEIENPTGQYPIRVTFQKKDPDILPKGTLVRSFDPPYHQEDFAFFLNISGFGALPYNPFQPFTEHRQIDITFTPQTPGAVPQTYVADFRVDYYSAAGVSILLAIGSATAFIVTLVGNTDRTRRIFGVLGRIGSADADSL